MNAIRDNGSVLSFSTSHNGHHNSTIPTLPDFSVSCGRTKPAGGFALRLRAICLTYSTIEEDDCFASGHSQIEESFESSEISSKKNAAQSRDEVSEVRVYV